MLSDKFLASLKRSTVPAYRLCSEAGVDPTWFSKAIRGAIKIKRGDPRITAIAKRLELTASQVWEPRDSNRRTAEA